MSASGNSSLIFQYYLDNHFKIPKIIRNDIVYCQRALRSHIKVHQVVNKVFREQKYIDENQKARILEEIETEIYEINAEQQLLFMRLRRIVDEFYKMLKRKAIEIDRNATNMIVSQSIVPLIQDEHIEITPTTIAPRWSEKSLMAKYFEIEPDDKKILYEDKKVYEILDSEDEEEEDEEDEDEDEDIDEDDDCVLLVGDNLPKKAILNGRVSVQNVAKANGGKQQISLLKPISQRLNNNSNNNTASLPAPAAAPIATAAVTNGRGGRNANNNQTASNNANTTKSNTAKNVTSIAGATNGTVATTGTPVELPVSKNVQKSRLNLRQALKKAKNETMAAKAAAKERSAPPATTKRSSPTNENVLPKIAAEEQPTKKTEGRTRSTRSAAAAATVNAGNSATLASKIELNSSSDDSNAEREVSPTSQLSEDFKTQPEHYGQEMFLRLFNLFTFEMHTQMQQRRSKRKRRNVHSNERADFHYGRIDHSNSQPPEKKCKEFLLSPNVKRGLQAKAAKIPKRSSTSSPDEKKGCNECLKTGGSVDQCEECKGYYHQACHREEDDIKPINIKKSTANKLKLCPACKRRQQKLLLEERERNLKTLQNSAQELEKQLAKEKERRASLQEDGKMYKIQMQNILTIVNKLKSESDLQLKCPD